jgi:hypothetical protein
MLGAGVPTRQVDLPDIGRGAHVEGFDLILAKHAPLVEMIDLLLLDLAEESDLGGRKWNGAVACGTLMKIDDSKRTTASEK